jgi:hypothetical protein
MLLSMLVLSKHLNEDDGIFLNLLLLFSQIMLNKLITNITKYIFGVRYESDIILLITQVIENIF